MKKNLRMICLLSAIIIVLSLLVPGALGSVPIARAADSVEITILHTNDVHARVGVEPYVATLKKQYQDAGKNVLLLSAGDVLHGQPIATLQKGESIVEIMNEAEYDAMSPGNHDFNYGYNRLLELEAKMSFPVLGSNVQLKSNNTNIFEDQYIVIEFEGVKVGVFGLATPETVTKTNPLNVQGLDFQDPATVAAQMVSELRENQDCDVVIALVHLGLDEATLPAERSTAVAAVEGIDLVVDGHSHTKLENGKTDHTGAPIVQAYQYGQSIGEVTLNVDSDKEVTVDSMKLHNSTDTNNPVYDWAKDSDVADIIDVMNEENMPVLSKVVAHTEHSLWGGTEYTRNAETNLANLITDAMLAESGADIAFTNGGGIRAVIPAGDITVEQITTVLPFGNFIVTREVTGANIKAALEFGVSDYPNRAGKYPQIAGLQVVFDPGKPAGERLVSVLLPNGSPLQDDKTYTLATNDFMAVGGDGYTMLATGGFMSYCALDEALIDYLGTNPEIKAEAEGRLSALIAADSISLDKTEITLAPGETFSLNSTILPDTVNENVNWTSDNTQVATVDQNGKVTAVASGVANITATTEYSGKTAICKVNVSQSPTPKAGWVNEDGVWRYYGEDGKPVTGWLKDDGKWYYLGDSGAMQTGWVKLGSTWYYLQSSGAMQTGWVKLGSTWYYLQSSGAMQTGWYREGNTWYYLKSSGAMAAAETLTVSGKRHRFNANGKWLGTV